MSQVAILIVLAGHSYKLAIITLDLPIVVRRDAKDHSIPLVHNAFGQVLHLWHIRSVKGVCFDRASQLLAIVLQRVRLDVQSVDHFQDLLHNLDIWIGAVGQRV